MSQKVKEKVKKPEAKTYNLTEFEFAYIMELNQLLTYHTAREPIIENFLTYVAMQRLGYSGLKKGHKLKFEVDSGGPKDKPNFTVKISQMPIDIAK